jgi:hypothetical protein
MDPTPEPRAGRRRRVLIEHPSSLVRLELAEELRAAGYDVRGCAGPSAPIAVSCPLLAGERCPWVDDADVIVNALHAHQATILEQQRRTTQLPLLVLAGPGQTVAPADPTEVGASARELVAEDLIGGSEVVVVLEELLRATPRPE